MTLMDLMSLMQGPKPGEAAGDPIGLSNYITVLKWHIDSHVSHLTLFHIVTFGLLFGVTKERTVFLGLPRMVRLLVIAAYAIVAVGTQLNLYNDFSLHNNTLAMASKFYPLQEEGGMFKRVPWELAVPFHSIIALGMVLALFHLLKPSQKAKDPASSA